VSKQEQITLQHDTVQSLDITREVSPEIMVSKIELPVNQDFDYDEPLKELTVSSRKLKFK
jgi:hypothetical protein